MLSREDYGEGQSEQDWTAVGLRLDGKKQPSRPSDSTRSDTSSSVLFESGPLETEATRALASPGNQMCKTSLFATPSPSTASALSTHEVFFVEPNTTLLFIGSCGVSPLSL